jgi:hypothetical protein
MIKSFSELAKMPKDTNEKETSPGGSERKQRPRESSSKSAPRKE